MRFEDCAQAGANHLVVVGDEDAGHRRPLRAHSRSRSVFSCRAVVEPGSNHHITIGNSGSVRIMENPETSQGNPEEINASAWHTESSASGALQLGTHHFALHGIIERHPRCFQLGSEGSAELLFQARYQRLAERNEMWWLRPKADVMPARFADDRLKQVALVEGADNGGDRIHQLEMLSFHVAGK